MHHELYHVSSPQVCSIRYRPELNGSKIEGLQGQRPLHACYHRARAKPRTALSKAEGSSEARKMTGRPILGRQSGVGSLGDVWLYS